MFLWDMKWWPFALTHGINPLVTHYLYAPTGANLAWTVPIPLIAAVAAPLWHVMSAAAVYNVSSGIALVSSALAAFLLLRMVFADVYAALIGGALYGFSPFMMSQALGHINLYFAPLLPLMMATVYLYAVGRLTGKWFVGLSALLIVLLFLVYEETVALSAVVAAATTLVALASTLRKPQERAFIVRTALRLACAYALAGVALLPYLVTQFVTTPSLRPPDMLQTPNTYVIDLFNLFLPTPITAFGGKLFAFISTHYTGNLSEWGGYIGIFLLGVLIVGVHRWIRGDRGMASVASVATAGVLLLSLGPYLHLAGDPKVSLTLALPMNGRLSIPLVLPWWPLGHLPVLKDALPGRLMVFVDLGLALLVADWTRKASLWRVIVGGLCVLLTTMPAIPYTSHKLSIPPFFTKGRLPAYVQGANVLMFPIDTGSDPLGSGTSMVDQAVANFSFAIPDGYTGSYFPHGAVPEFSMLQRATELQSLSAVSPEVPVDLAVLNQFIRQAGVKVLMVADQPRWANLRTLLTGDLGTAGVQSGGMVLWPLSKHCILRLGTVQVQGDYWPGPGGLIQPEWMGKTLDVRTHGFGGTLAISGQYRPQALGALPLTVTVNGSSRQYKIEPSSVVLVRIPQEATVDIQAARTWVPEEVIHNGDPRHLSVQFKIVQPVLSACTKSSAPGG